MFQPTRNMDKRKCPTVVFIGQPNCGKSTLFNSIAGLKAETSNFPGTSVKHTHSLVSIDGQILNIIDLPGTYSLCPQDPAEKIALSHLFSEKPDVVVNVVDASTLSRGLELTIELLELGYPMVIALNMMDVAERKGIKLDVQKLGQSLGVAVVPTVALFGRGVKELLEQVLKIARQPEKSNHLTWSEDVEATLRDFEQSLSDDFSLVGSRRFSAVKLIEADSFYCGELLKEISPQVSHKLDEVKAKLSLTRGVPAYEVIAAERHHLAMKIFEQASRIYRGRQTSWEMKMDSVLMHPVLGYPILGFILLIFFFLIYKIGGPLETLLLGPLNGLKAGLESQYGQSMFFPLLDGIIQGVGGGAAIVLPYFIPLVTLMSLLEDAGYTARVGFLLDSFMHRLGLHGKSVSPFILSFGCNVPAIMATRILESRRDRILTSLLIPFIPCSARNTIILALVAFYLGPFYALGFYFLNLMVIVLLGNVISRLLKQESPGLILEIPPLRLPTFMSIIRKVWLQLKSFLGFAWPLLIAGSVLLSILTYAGATPLINKILAPVVQTGLGLPQQLGITLIFGFLRRELSLIMMLQALGVNYQNLLNIISVKQILIFTVFVNFFLPCLSTLVFLWREIGRKWAIVSVFLSISVAIFLSLLVRMFF